MAAGVVLVICITHAMALRAQAINNPALRPKKWENVPAVKAETKDPRVRRDAISCWNVD